MRKIIYILVVLLIGSVPSQAEVSIDGFVQGLFGGRIDENNPTSTEQTASETRLQLRLEHFGDNAEIFGRLDYLYDGADSAGYDWELREAFMKFRLGSSIDVKVGRQILTWGTGDLLFINDVFAKDYRSFFIGRNDQYLKAPQNAVRIEYYSPIGGLNFVWSPRFEANRLPTGRRLSYYQPTLGTIVGTGIDDQFFFDPDIPDSKFENGEFAVRLQRQMFGFATAFYFYKGFYKNPVGFDPSEPTAYYPHLNVYGYSARGAKLGGVLWLEGGYFDSREDQTGNDPLIPNSTIIGLAGYERQIATNLTANIQGQVDAITNYEKYISGQMMMGAFVRDEVRLLLTSRLRKLLLDENLTLQSFVFYSPTDEDSYIRLNVDYKYTDEITLAMGGNIFTAKNEATEFGQFQRNDNIFMKMTYGF